MDSAHSNLGDDPPFDWQPMLNVARNPLHCASISSRLCRWPVEQQQQQQHSSQLVAGVRVSCSHAASVKFECPVWIVQSRVSSQNGRVHYYVYFRLLGLKDGGRFLSLAWSGFRKEFTDCNKSLYSEWFYCNRWSWGNTASRRNFDMSFNPNRGTFNPHTFGGSHISTTPVVILWRPREQLYRFQNEKFIIISASVNN